MRCPLHSALLYKCVLLPFKVLHASIHEYHSERFYVSNVFVVRQIHAFLSRPTLRVLQDSSFSFGGFWPFPYSMKLRRRGENGLFPEILMQLSLLECQHKWLVHPTARKTIATQGRIAVCATSRELGRSAVINHQTSMSYICKDFFTMRFYYLEAYGTAMWRLKICPTVLEGARGREFARTITKVYTQFHFTNTSSFLFFVLDETKFSKSP